MIDIRRRGFLFGAVATLIVPAPKSFYIAPADIVSPVHLSRRLDKGPTIWQAFRTVERLGVEYDAHILYVASEDGGDTPEIRAWAENNLRMPPL